MKKTLSALAITLAIITGWVLSRHTDSPKQEAKKPASVSTFWSHRTVYPYSVVPGGILSADELKTALRDPVTAQHYAGFDFNHARIVEIKPQSAYVSFRLNGKIYWTTKKLLLAQHEKFLTDGHFIARLRCGNQLSLTPQFPVLRTDEPTAEMLDTPDAVASGKINPLALDTQSVLAPPTGTEPVFGIFNPPDVFVPLPVGLPIGGPTGCVPIKDHPCKHGHEPPPPAVPEPETWLLFITGAVMIVGAALLRRTERA